MKRSSINRITLMLAVSLAVSLLSFGVALAADEDTSSSAYLVFDPDTGEFITVHDPNRTQQHIADQEAITSVAPGAEVGKGARASIAQLTVAVLAGAAALGGAWLVRRRRSHS